MNNAINFVLDTQTVEKLAAYGELLGKDASTMLNEALQQYFMNEEKKLLEQKLSEKDPMTDLSFDEFWDDVDF